MDVLCTEHFLNVAWYTFRTAIPFQEWHSLLNTYKRLVRLLSLAFKLEKESIDFQ